MEQLGQHNPARNAGSCSACRFDHSAAIASRPGSRRRNFKAADGFRLLALGGKPRSPFFEESAVKSTADWKKVEVVFNSLEEKEVSLFAGIWGGRSGKLWLADLGSKKSR